MAEYIKREDAIHDIMYDCFGLENYTRRDAIDCINALPAADVTEVRHGRWLEGKSLEKCSLCGKKGFPDWNYCPNCGARMDKEYGQ